MIELNDKSYIVGLWFSSCPITNNDWLACMIKDPEQPTRYKGWYRFRYVKDDKIWGSEDEKKWTNFTSQDGLTDEDMIKVMELAQNLREAYPDKDHVIVKGDLKKMLELVEDKPWMNIKVEKVEKQS